MNLIRRVFPRSLTTKLFLQMARKNQGSVSKTALNFKSGLDDFDYLSGIDLISSQKLNTDMMWIDEVKTCYEKDDQQCLNKLRIRQQNLLQKMLQGQIDKEKMLSVYALERALFLKFRKWQQIIVNVSNAHQIIKKKVIEMNHNTAKSETEILQLYNQYCAVLILSDYDKLHDLLTNKQKILQRGRKSKSDKYTNKEMGDIIYQLAAEVARTSKPDQPHYRAYFDTVLMQSIGLLALGEKNEAIKTLGCVLNDNYSKQYKEKAYIILLTSLTYQNESLPSPSVQILEKILDFKPILQSDLKQLSKSGLKTQQSEQMINELVKRIRNKPVSALQIYQLRIYGRLLCLIAQNYYIEGRVADYLRVMQQLQKLEMDQAIQILITFVKMGILFDQNQTTKIIQLFQIFRKSQASQTSDGKQFYNPKTINQDQVKINIYKLAKNAYIAEGNEAQAQKIEIQARMLEGTLGIYTMKEPQFEDQQQLAQNWRGCVNSQIPYYYLEMQLQEMFEPNWSINCSLD